MSRTAALLLAVLWTAAPLAARAAEDDPEPKRGGPFALRTGKARERALKQNGGNARVEKAVADGLRWLALHQADDGRWSLHEFNSHARDKPLPEGKAGKDDSTHLARMRNDTAGTVLALLPFLANGHTHKAPREKEPVDYRKSVAAGLKWLLKQQSPQGADRGRFDRDMYAHALATVAVCEAYGMTGDRALRGPAQLALDYLVAAQHERGGWRYTPRTPGDLSITGFVVEALQAGRMAGLKVPGEALKKAGRFVDSCEVARGEYGYVPAGSRTPAMTAKGALTRQLLGADRRDANLLASAAVIRKTPPTSGVGIYHHYHATRVMFNLGGGEWADWNLGPKGDGKGGMRDELLATQDDGANRKGNKGSWLGVEHIGGRLGATSFTLLTLQVYWRYPAAGKGVKERK